MKRLGLDVSDLVIVAGVGVVLYGVSLLSVAAAFVAGGIFISAFGLVIARRTHGSSGR